jgi:drug/metabolite transporter (DMT)-like permease
MLAFAANSLLTRMALGDGRIDASSFTAVRMAAGAVMLLLIVVPRWRRGGLPPMNVRAAAMLFAYMACFSFAYLSLSAGTGALLLFGAVQLTMFVAALRAGEYFAPLSWGGFALAVGGLVYLVSPGLAAPDPVGALLMLAAGVAWGFYSLLGRGGGDPLYATAGNFVLGVPFVLCLSGAALLVQPDALRLQADGVWLAIGSGAIASALGYVVWYAALQGLTATRAATVQLSVPVIAAVGGAVLLAEPLTARLAWASAVTLGGIAIVLLQRGGRRRRV